MPISALPDTKEADEALVCVLRAPQYVVSGSVGMIQKAMRTTLITFDAGAGVSIARESVLPVGWERHLIADAELPKLGDANGRRLPLRGALQLRVRLGNFVYPPTVLVAPRLSVPMILGTGFMKRHVTAIRCIDQKIEMQRGGRLPILANGNQDDRVTVPDADPATNGEREPEGMGNPGSTTEPRTKGEADPLGLKTSPPVRFSKAVRLAPFSQTRVSVVTKGGRPRHD